MKTIWKYVLNIADAQEVEIPLPATVLAVQMQPTPNGETICLWAEVDPEADKVRVPIHIAGTGHRLPELPPGLSLRHISTFQTHDGALVFHAYEGMRRALS